MGNNYANKETQKGGVVTKATEGFKQFRKEYQLADRCCRMYVKPFSKAGVEELENLRTSAFAADRIKIEEKDGTYEITSLQPIVNMDDYIYTLWGILHRKYERQASELACESTVSMVGCKRALKWHENDLGIPAAEEDRDKNFYILTISPKFIAATTLPRFRTAA